VKIRTLDPATQFHAEVATSFSIMAAIAEEVRAARAESQFPLILAGNCNTSVVPVLAASITAYDSEVDRDGATLRSCIQVIETILTHKGADGSHAIARSDVIQKDGPAYSDSGG
jgi:hypothetical protein